MPNQSFNFTWLVKLLLLAVIAVPSAAQPSGQQKEQPQKFHDIMLETHNKERSLQGLQRLSWDDGLARDALVWAQKLAKESKFEHAFKEIGKKGQGENLWMGTADYFSQQAMVEMWLAEKRVTKSGTFPDVSTTGNWSEVGHYTQIIWPTTQKLGCALGRNQKDEFLVCRYWPAGNIIGTKLELQAHE